MKKLPSIFQNDINKKLNNNEDVYYSFNRNEEINDVNDINVLQKINSLFNSSNYIYKLDVEIKLKDKTINEKIIAKNKTHLITINNKLIPINDILDINLIKKS